MTRKKEWIFNVQVQVKSEIKLTEKEALGHLLKMEEVFNTPSEAFPSFPEKAKIFLVVPEPDPNQG